MLRRHFNQAGNLLRYCNSGHFAAGFVTRHAGSDDTSTGNLPHWSIVQLAEDESVRQRLFSFCPHQQVNLYQVFKAQRSLEVAIGMHSWPTYRVKILWIDRVAERT